MLDKVVAAAQIMPKEHQTPAGLTIVRQSRARSRQTTYFRLLILIPIL